MLGYPYRAGKTLSSTCHHHYHRKQLWNSFSAGRLKILNFASNHQIHHCTWYNWWCRTCYSVQNFPALFKFDKWQIIQFGCQRSQVWFLSTCWVWLSELWLLLATSAFNLLGLGRSRSWIKYLLISRTSNGSGETNASLGWIQALCAFGAWLP